MVHQPYSIVQNLVYPQQCHIGSNVDHWRVIIIARHKVAFCIFSCRTLNNFYKLLVIIVICNEKQTNWPYKRNYVKTSRYFLPRILLCFYQIQEKLKTCRNLYLINSRRPSFEDDIHVNLCHNNQCLGFWTTLCISQILSNKTNRFIWKNSIFGTDMYLFK